MIHITLVTVSTAFLNRCGYTTSIRSEWAAYLGNVGLIKSRANQLLCAYALNRKQPICCDMSTYVQADRRLTSSDTIFAQYTACYADNVTLLSCTESV